MTAGDLGAQLVRGGAGPHEVEARHLRANSPLAVAGIRNGGRLRLDHPWDDLRMMPAGDQLGLTWLKPGSARHVGIVVPPVAPTSLARRIATHVNLFANAPMLCESALILRGYRYSLCLMKTCADRRGVGIRASGMVAVVAARHNKALPGHAKAPKPHCLLEQTDRV